MFHTQMNQDWHGPQVWGQGGWAAAGRFDFWVVWAKTMGQSGLSSHPWAHFHWVLASFQPFLTAWPAVAPQPSKTQWATPGPRGLWASHSWPQTGHDCMGHSPLEHCVPPNATHKARGPAVEFGFRGASRGAAGHFEHSTATSTVCPTFASMVHPPTAQGGKTNQNAEPPHHGGACCFGFGAVVQHIACA